jgi:hypothetical protein
MSARRAFDMPSELPKALLLLMLSASCGGPGNTPAVDSGREAQRVDSITDTAPASPASPSPPAEPETTDYSGAFRRTSTASEFAPCGSKKWYDVAGRPEAIQLLMERHLWSSVQFERPVFVTLHGALVTESQPGDSAAATSHTFFSVTRLVLLRTWRGTDCGGVAPPRR